MLGDDALITDKKGDNTKIRPQQYKELNALAKGIQQLNPGGPEHNFTN